MDKSLRGWKPNAGYVTLVVVFILIGGWMRSLISTDIMQFSSGNHAFDDVTSVDQVLVWGRNRTVEPQSVVTRPEWRSFEGASFDVFLDRLDRECSWRWCGFGVGELKKDSSKPLSLSFWSVPYWSIVLPLTLLSAYLLVSKPRPNTTVKTQVPSNPQI